MFSVPGGRNRCLDGSGLLPVFSQGSGVLQQLNLEPEFFEGAEDDILVILAGPARIEGAGGEMCQRNESRLLKRKGAFRRTGVSQKP